MLDAIGVASLRERGRSLALEAMQH
jgi:hypothetical protein